MLSTCFVKACRMRHMAHPLVLRLLNNLIKFTLFYIVVFTSYILLLSFSTPRKYPNTNPKKSNPNDPIIASISIYLSSYFKVQIAPFSSHHRFILFKDSLFSGPAITPPG